MKLSILTATKNIHLKKNAFMLEKYQYLRFKIDWFLKQKIWIMNVPKNIKTIML